MIAEITPTARAAAATTIKTRTLVWLRGPISYVIAHIASATMVGLIAGLIGTGIRLLIPGTEGLFWLAATVASILYGLHELGIIRLFVPERKWQVPVAWSNRGKTKFKQSILYGLVLGADVFTYMPYASFYVLILIEMTLGFPTSTILGLAYGGARAIPTFFSFVYAANRQDTSKLALKIDYLIPLGHKINGVVLVVIGVLLFIK